MRREQLKILKRDKTHHRFLNDANELLIDYTITCDGDVLTFSEHVKMWRVYVVQTLVPEHCRAHYSSCNCFLSGSSSEHKDKRKSIRLQVHTALLTKSFLSRIPRKRRRCSKFIKYANSRRRYSCERARCVCACQFPLKARDCTSAIPGQ